ncbi:Meiotically up-regulated gene 84 protein like [Verticillium longisporum]|nr:Meiotically up-regulated gene 84 protein like [Verticillium longisporum]
MSLYSEDEDRVPPDTFSDGSFTASSLSGSDSGSFSGSEDDESPPLPVLTNYFAPPFYGRPPTPLPPSPSLTSLLRPSRPTTPDPSDDDIEPVPRASPKVPTYEYYGFVLYLFSTLSFLVYLLWSYLPSPFLHVLGIYYYPNRWWSLAIPAWITMLLVYIYVALAAYNTEVMTLPMASVETIVDDTAQVAVIDSKGRIRHGAKRRQKDKRDRRINGGPGLDWKEIWNEGTDAVMDVPLAGVCEVLYGDIDNSSATLSSSRVKMAPSPEQIASNLLTPLNLAVTSIRPLQTLWAGYGTICSVRARPITPEAATAISSLLSTPITPDTEIPLILKLISPPKAKPNDEGHLRKILSYEVEQCFYAHLAPKLSDDVGVAKCIASSAADAGALDGIVAMVLADLRPQYPVAGGKRDVLSSEQVDAALTWLGRFHAESRAWVGGERAEYVLPPLQEARRREEGNRGTKVWLNGGYTYLATRLKEYASLEADDDSEWSGAFCDHHEELGGSIAEAVAEVLKPTGRGFESVIHGDVKSENLFTTVDGNKVAFFDFQYVGLGLGVCDLAKLFTCSVPLELITGSDEWQVPMDDGEKELLRRYRAALLNGKGDESYPWDDFVRHWECALVDWCRFQASWGFWGNTEWLEARVRSILGDQAWRAWLQDELQK